RTRGVDVDIRRREPGPLFEGQPAVRQRVAQRRAAPGGEGRGRGHREARARPGDRPCLLRRRADAGSRGKTAGRAAHGRHACHERTDPDDRLPDAGCGGARRLYRVRRRPPPAQTRALRVLKEVAEALNRATTEQHATGEALSRMVDLLGVETGWVWLRDPASDRFYNAAVQSLPPYLQEPVRMTGRSCWCLELFKSGQLDARNIDVVECSRLAPAVESHETAATHGLRCHASVPLYAADRPLGVMNLAMRGWRRLTRQELDLLTTIADQVGVAIERARLGEQSIEHARADERSRIARDVHDTFAQEFTAVGLHIEAGLSHLEPRNEARPALNLALEAARQGLEGARRSITSLRASPLENRSLAEALGALSRRFTADTG